MEKAPQGTATATIPVPTDTDTIPVMQKKKDEQDGSFLIIDDSMNAKSLPDTAVQLFDTTPVISSPVAEISFFSSTIETAQETPIEIVVENTTTSSSSSDISFFSEPTSVNELISWDIDDTASSEQTLVDMDEGGKTEAIDITEPLVVTDMTESIQVWNIFSESVEVDSFIIPKALHKNDIYDPVRKAIAEYDSILEEHAKISEAIDNRIADRNARIAEEKAAAKKDLDERKTIDTEINKIQQMKDLFSAQLK